MVYVMIFQHHLIVALIVLFASVCFKIGYKAFKTLQNSALVCLFCCALYDPCVCCMCMILQAERSAEDRPERYGPVQQHRRMVASLNKQIQLKTKELEEVTLVHPSLLGYSLQLC